MIEVIGLIIVGIFIVTIITIIFVLTRKGINLFDTEHSNKSDKSETKVGGLGSFRSGGAHS